MNLEIVSPLQNSSWDKDVLGARNYTIFHSVCWARTLAEAYRYGPFYFVLTNGGKTSAILACMEVNSIFTGKRGVCLPFSDYCPPLSSDPKQFQTIFSEAIRWGKERRWKYLEWRAGDSVLDGQVPYQTYVGYRLSLERSENELLERMRDSTKRNVQKAIREGVQVSILQNEEAMNAFSSLNSITRREHGLPPQPKRFFRKVYEHVVRGEKGYVFLAIYEKKPIAANVFFHFGKKAIFKYGASDKRFHNLRGNNLVTYAAIRLYARQGFHTLDLGRTDCDNKGLLQFKRGWGGIKYPIHYYRYNLGRGSFEKKEHKFSNYAPLVRKMPLPLLRIFGEMFYRHMG